MYREDLEALVGLFQKACSAITISDGKNRYDSLSEMRQYVGSRIKDLRRGVFRDSEELIMAIGTYIDRHHESPKPFLWTAPATDLLEKVKRARHTLNKRRSV